MVRPCLTDLHSAIYNNDAHTAYGVVDIYFIGALLYVDAESFVKNTQKPVIWLGAGKSGALQDAIFK